MSAWINQALNYIECEECSISYEANRSLSFETWQHNLEVDINLICVCRLHRKSYVKGTLLPIRIFFTFFLHMKKLNLTKKKKLVLLLCTKSIHEGKPPGKMNSFFFFVFFPHVAIGSQFYLSRNSEISSWKSESWVDLFQNVDTRYFYSTWRSFF